VVVKLLLEISDLAVEVNVKEILSDIDLYIDKEQHMFF
jgi:Fe-S cluster assembly ATP-binding protein